MWHAKAFNTNPSSPRFFVELQHHISEQNSINKHLIRLAKELDLPLVCDNDAHFLKAEDHDGHDTLVCISTSKGKHDEQRMRYPPQLYVKSPSEMRDLAEEMSSEIAAEWATACDNTVKIAERCNVKLPLVTNADGADRPAQDQGPAQARCAGVRGRSDGVV